MIRSQDTSASRARARPLRMRLLLLAASGLVPLALVLVWGLDYLIEERRVQAQRSVLELSRALATAIDAELRSVTALLENMETSDELERADLRAFQLTARRTAEQLGWRQVEVSDGEGRILLRTNEPLGTSDPGSIEPRSLVRTIQTRAPVVSQIVETPNFKSDAFAVRVPVTREGKVVYVLSAVLSSDTILAVLTRQNIPSGSVTSVFDQVHRRVARSRQVASPFPSASLQALLNRGDNQGVGSTITREGIENYTGYTRLSGSGWVVVVGHSVADANKGLYALLRAVAMGLIASLALAALLAWVLSRRVLGPIDALKQAAAALGRGDPVELSAMDIDELNDVALALTQAAARRDHSMLERDRAASEREQLLTRITDALRMAEEASRSKDQFLAVLGHELRNPLAPIATAVKLMALKGDEKTARERGIIERQLVYVTRLVDDLLDVSRITSGRLTLRREPLRLAALLAQVVETIRPSLNHRLLSLELGQGMETAWVAGDEARLVQVFNNLLINAIKFTPAGGSILVQAGLMGNQAQVDVKDSGIGLSPAQVDRIFDLFYQAPQNSDRARGGLGLGLTIVRSLVEMHSGSVHAASDGPGLGSCFTVRLPLCQPPAANQNHASTVTRPGAGNILVVDDNEDAADTCAAFLQMSGYTVRVAYTPEAALKVLQEFEPGVAVLDIGLPGMSGHELAARMKSHGFRGKLVALTGYGQSADMAASHSAGFDAHLTKPASPAELLELVNSVLR